MFEAAWPDVMPPRGVDHARSHHRRRRVHRGAPRRGAASPPGHDVRRRRLPDRLLRPRPEAGQPRPARATPGQVTSRRPAHATTSRRLLDGVEVVFHQAGQPGVRLSWAEGSAPTVEQRARPPSACSKRAAGRSCGASCTRRSRRSTASAERYPTTEDDLPRPRSPYGVTKLAAEHLCGLYARQLRRPHRVAAVLHRLRPPPAPGHGHSPVLRRDRERAAAADLRGREQVRDFTFVSDVVAANIAAADADVAPGTVLNVAGGGSISVNDLVAAIGRTVGHEVEMQRLPEQPGDVRRHGGSIERTQRAARLDARGGRRGRPRGPMGLAASQLEVSSTSGWAAGSSASPSVAGRTPLTARRARAGRAGAARGRPTQHPGTGRRLGAREAEPGEDRRSDHRDRGRNHEQQPAGPGWRRRRTARHSPYITIVATAVTTSARAVNPATSRACSGSVLRSRNHACHTM